MSKKAQIKKPVHDQKTGSGAITRKEEPVKAAPVKPASVLSAFWLQAVILAIVGVIFYSNTFTNGYAFDDRLLITENENVQAGVQGISKILTSDAFQSYTEQQHAGNQLQGGRYRPLSLITFAIEQQILGINDTQDSVGMQHGAVNKEREAKLNSDMHVRHVVNVLLYIVSVIVLLSFFRKIVFRENTLAAFVAALLFLVLPVHTEVVANVKSRDEILSVLFICLTFIFAFRYRDGRKVGSLIAALVCYFLALMSKEYAVTLIAMLPVAFYVFRKESWGKSITGTAWYLVPLAIYLLLRLSSVSAPTEDSQQNVLNNPYLFATPAQKLASELVVLFDYLRLLIYPNVLVADYSYKQIPYSNFSDPIVWVSIAIYIAIIVVAVVALRKRSLIGFALVFYLFNLALVSNLFFNIGAPKGDRLIYHSSVGFAIVVAYLLVGAVGYVKPKVASQAVLAAVILVIVSLSAIRVIARNKEWKNDKTLFLTDVKKVPNSALVNNNAGAACYDYSLSAASEIEKAKWLQQAVYYYSRALQIDGKYGMPHLNRGVCYYNLDKKDSALMDFDSARVYMPMNSNLAYDLSTIGDYFFKEGVKYGRNREPLKAIEAFKKGASATPRAADMWYNLGAAYNEAGMYEQAKSALEKSLKLDSTYPNTSRLYQEVKARLGQ